MFTGIIQSVATITTVKDHNGIRTFILDFSDGFCEGLEIGASVAVDGVCLTVTELLSINRVSFDVMLQSLAITSLSDFSAGQQINVERAAKEGAEIGGHPLSGHVDFTTYITEILQQDDNYCLRFHLDSQWQRYIFAKGYIALNGASLTISNVDKTAAWFEVWLIPETLRMTTFKDKNIGSVINVEIERTTQVIVDTVRDALNEQLGPMLPLLKQLLQQQGFDLPSLGQGSKTKLDKNSD